MAAKSSASPFKFAGAAGLAPDQAAAKVIKRFQCCWMGQFARPTGSRVNTDNSTHSNIDDGSHTCVAAGGIVDIGPGAIILLRR